MAVFSGAAHAYRTDTAPNAFVCLPANMVMVNNLKFAGSQKKIIPLFGSPIRVRRYTIESGGNSGTYPIREYKYDGLIIGARDDPQVYANNRIDIVKITSSNYRFARQFYVGQPKHEIMKALNVRGEQDFFDRKEANLFLQGKQLKVKATPKTSWVLSICDNQTTTIYFDFKADKLAEIEVIDDDSSI